MNDVTLQASVLRNYYEGLSRGVFRAMKCSRCNGITFPPTGCCEHCGGWDVEETALSGDATLVFATHNITPACHPRFEEIAPYVYGHLQLAELALRAGDRTRRRGDTRGAAQGLRGGAGAG